MKNLVVIFLFLLCAIPLHAQIYVDDVDINKLDHVHMIEIQSELYSFRSSLHVYVDYGQEDGSFKSKRTMLLDGISGDPVSVYSNVAMLNLFYEKGWELITTYIISEKQNNKDFNEIVVYILKKRKT